jgi:hypothetical protein
MVCLSDASIGFRDTTASLCAGRSCDPVVGHFVASESLQQADGGPIDRRDLSGRMKDPDLGTSAVYGATIPSDCEPLVPPGDDPFSECRLAEVHEHEVASVAAVCECSSKRGARDHREGERSRLRMSEAPSKWHRRSMRSRARRFCRQGEWCSSHRQAAATCPTRTRGGVAMRRHGGR